MSSGAPTGPDSTSVDNTSTPQSQIPTNIPSTTAGKDIKDGTNEATKNEAVDVENKDMADKLTLEAWTSIPPEQQLELMMQARNKITKLSSVEAQLKKQEEEKRQTMTDNMLADISKLVAQIEQSQGAESAKKFSDAVDTPIRSLIATNPPTQRLEEESNIIGAMVVHGSAGWNEVSKLRQEVENQKNQITRYEQVKGFIKNWDDTTSGTGGPMHFSKLSTNRTAPYHTKTVETSTTVSETSSTQDQSSIDNDLMGKWFGF